MAGELAPRADVPLSRRRLLQRWALLGGAVAVSGCGFQLRGTANLDFDSIALAGFAPRSPLEAELRAALARSVTVQVAPDKADVVLRALSEQRTRKVVAFTASGQVRDIQLRLLLRYQAHTPRERVLIPESEIIQWRDMTFIESKALGKEQEEQQLYREMQADIIAQLLLRLSTIRLG
jgi:LPS-assembly lipoprotein